MTISGNCFYIIDIICLQTTSSFVSKTIIYNHTLTNFRSLIDQCLRLNVKEIGGALMSSFMRGSRKFCQRGSNFAAFFFDERNQITP